jgi:hypothetical protein
LRGAHRFQQLGLGFEDYFLRRVEYVGFLRYRYLIDYPLFKADFLEERYRPPELCLLNLLDNLMVLMQVQVLNLFIQEHLRRGEKLFLRKFFL